jgi:hypothetical protein
MKMNKLDKTTDDWLEMMSKAHELQKERKRGIGTVIAMSMVVPIVYVFSILFTMDKTAENSFYYHFDEMPVIIALVYIFIMLTASIIYLSVVKYRNRHVKRYANETMAEGMVYSSRVVTRITDSEDEVSIRNITNVYEILIAVRGLDKFLRAYVRVKVMENKKNLPLPKWEKGDKTPVMYDLVKPRTCRIANVEKFIDAGLTNGRMR